MQTVESKKRRLVPIKKSITFFSKYDLWMYDAVLDNRICTICIGHERTARFFGSELRTTFPYLVILGVDTIGGLEGGDGLAHPNCRCRLHRITEWDDDTLQWFINYAGTRT